MNDPLLVISSCPRGGAPSPYLPELRRRVGQECGLALPAVITDGPQSDPMYGVRDGWLEISLLLKHGAKRTLWMALEMARERRAERLVFLEDDVLPCKGAVRRMFEQPVPNDAAFVSFFDLGVAFGSAGVSLPARGLYRMPMHAFMSTCALVFPLRSVDFLTARGAPVKDWCGHDDRDTAVNHSFRDGSPWQYYALHVPAIFQHVGEVSAIKASPGGAPKAPDFPGEEFEAASLPVYDRYCGFIELTDWAMSGVSK